jgi:hypothetical protein
MMRAKNLVYIMALLPIGAQGLSSSAVDVPSKSQLIVKNKMVPGLQSGMDYVKLGDSDLTVSNICMG